MKILRRIANLGYGSRKQVTALFREGRVTHANGEVLYADDELGTHADHEDVRLDGEPLDPPPGLLVMLNKPTGYTCSTKDQGALIYELLPSRFSARNPVLSTVGRLDRETSGLLLLTDDGVLLHRITSPKSGLAKVYEASLARPLQGNEAQLFASGRLMLESELEPLLPAELQVLAPQRVRLTLHEGRYHQVRRMFAAVGNHVEGLHRIAVGGLDLGSLAPGDWRPLDDSDRALLFGGDSREAARHDAAQGPLTKRQ